MILSPIFFIAKLSREQYLKLVHCAHTKLTEQTEQWQFTSVLSMSSSIDKLVKSHPYFHSDHDSDSNSNVSSHPQRQRFRALQSEQRNFLHGPAQQQQPSLWQLTQKKFLSCSWETVTCDMKWKQMDDENGSSKCFILKLIFFSKKIQTTPRCFVDVTLLLQEESKYNATTYTVYIRQKKKLF